MKTLVTSKQAGKPDRPLKRMAQFGVVGVLGFVADAAVLMAAVPLLGLYGGRVASFAVAVLVTWVLNRTFTFADRRADPVWRELMLYVGSQSFGALTNMAVYALAIFLFDTMKDYPVAALALGSIAGMVVNYTAAHFVVFRGALRSQPSADADPQPNGP